MRGFVIAAALALVLVCAAPAKPASPHSRFSPDPGAARYWTHRFFGRGQNARLMLCVAYTESRYELGVSNGHNYGPWQINSDAHPWVNTWRLTHSWRYAAAVAWHISDHGTYFSPWRPDCGIS